MDAHQLPETEPVMEGKPWHAPELKSFGRVETETGFRPGPHNDGSFIGS